MTFPDRYKRNSRALSVDECALLAQATVGVVGCGGLGGYCLEELARVGVGRIVAIDGDVFEESNLNRQLLATEQNLGTPKAQAAAERIAVVNSSVKVDAHVAFLTAENAAELLAGCDCVVDALDNLEARFWLARACQEAGIPLVYGAIAGWFGQVCTVFPGDASFVNMYGSVEGAGAQVVEGNLPCTAATIASIQVSEVLKVLIGRGEVLRNRLMMVDLLDGSVETLELR